MTKRARKKARSLRGRNYLADKFINEFKSYGFVQFTYLCTLYNNLVYGEKANQKRVKSVLRRVRKRDKKTYNYIMSRINKKTYKR